MPNGKESSKRPKGIRKSSSRLKPVGKGGKAGGSGVGKVPPVKKGAVGRRSTMTKLKPVSGDGPSIPIAAAPSAFSIALPLWMKFATVICLLITLFLGIFGLFSSNLAQREINDQVNNTGKKLTLFVTDSVGYFWSDELDNPKKNKEKVRKDLRKYLEDQHHKDITNIMVVDNQNRYIVSGRDQEGRSLTLSAFVEVEKDERVTVQETELNGVLTRLFISPINNSDNQQVGKVWVFMNAQKINDIKDNLKFQIILFCIFGIILGTLVSFLISTFLTKPIQMLVQDIRAVSSGDFDHQTIPRSKDEIGELAYVFNDMTQQLKVAKEEEIKTKAMEHELGIATEIQTKLLPERIPQIPGYDIFSYYLSAKHVGGDYYDFIVVDPRHLGIVVADVSGKGIPGSMVMTMARSLIRLASRGNPSPSDTLRKVNKILAQDMKRGMFVTAIYMVLNIQTRQLTVCSAGHNPLVVYRAQTRDVELVKPQGIALGFDKGSIFDSNIAEEVIQLYPGDRLVAYTDGIVEAMSEEEEEFGDDPFYDLTRKFGSANSKEYINQVIHALQQHVKNAPQSDDITISTMKVE